LYAVSEFWPFCFMHRQKIDPYAAKADFFDGQVGAPWAADTYSPTELAKLERLFTVIGSLDGLRVLEPGCGTGRLTALLARKVGAKGRVVAVDISPCMVAEARRRLSGCHQVEIRLGAVEEIQGCPAYFDRVICHQVFPHFEDQYETLSMLARLLKPGGRLVISHFLSSAEINDVHRKADTVVARDILPAWDTLRRWCECCGLRIGMWQDDAEGYLLSAGKVPVSE